MKSNQHSLSSNTLLNQREIINDLSILSADKSDGHQYFSDNNIPSLLIHNISKDVLLKILTYLDPLNLYNISRSNQFFRSFVMCNLLWKNDLSLSCIQFFGIPSSNYILLRANDLYLIKTKINLTNDQIIIDNKNFLFLAVKYNAINFVELLLQHQVNPNILDEKSCHPLFIAVKQQSLKMVNLLLHYGANVNALNLNGVCALHIAAENGDIEIMKSLINKGADINIQHDNIFPLYVAMQEKKTAAVTLLLEKNVNVNLKYKGYSVLYIGAKMNHLEGVKALLNYYKTHKIDMNVNEINNDGSTALYVAAQNGHTEMVKLLLEVGAQVDSGFLGYTPLYIAAQLGHSQVVEILCQYQPNYNYIMTGNRSTALYIAAQNGHHKVVELLCQQTTCHIDAIFSDGYTPLYVACQNNHLFVVKILLKHQANINHQTKKGATPLYAASYKSNLSLVAFLLKKGANPHLCFENGDTPLHILCTEENNYNNCISKMTLLIQSGIDPLHLNHAGETAAGIAKNNNIKEVLKILEMLAKKIRLLSSLPHDHKVDSDVIINNINAFIAIYNSEKKKTQTEAVLCQDLLTKTTSSFGCAVILYSFLNSKLKNLTPAIFRNNALADKFTQNIINKLGFTSSFAAKSALYSQISASLGENQNLLDELKNLIIQPITYIFKNRKFNYSTYEIPIICLNLFEVKIKQSYTLATSFNRKKF